MMLTAVNFVEKIMASKKGSKQRKNLERRRSDYSRMIAGMRPEKIIGYHRPGSNKK